MTMTTKIKTKYGKNASKAIYVPPGTEYEETWKKVIDLAIETRTGVGVLLLDAYKQWEKCK